MDLRQTLKDLVRRIGGEDANGSFDMRNADGSVTPVVPRQGTDNVRLATTEVIELATLQGSPVMWRCGHRFPERFEVIAYGEKCELSDEYYQVRPSCGWCSVAYLRAESIRCGRCGHIIMPEDPSTLYPPTAEFMAHPHWVTMAFNKVVCCMRDRCVVSTGLYAGEWMGRQFHARFEGRTQNEEAMRTGKPITMRLPIRR